MHTAIIYSWLGLAAVALFVQIWSGILFRGSVKHIQVKLGNQLPRDNSILFARGYSYVLSLKRIISLNPSLNSNRELPNELRILRRYEWIAGALLGLFVISGIILGGIGLL